MQLGTYRVWTHNGTTDTGFDPVSLAKMFEASGAGEIVINSIDCDGMMNGYDIELASMVREAVSLPLTVLGGAGNLSHVQNLIKHLAPIGAAAGSIFVFKGVHRAVLINYPNRIQKRTLMQS
jgi:cyclase